MTEPDTSTDGGRRLPPDVGSALRMAIVGAIALVVLLALLLGIRQHDTGTRRGLNAAVETTAPVQPSTTTTQAETHTQAPVSARRVVLQNVIGMQLADGRRAFERQGLNVEVRRLRSDRPRGEVLRQRPEAGANVLGGGLVKLFVSDGSARPATATEVRVPRIVGLTASGAATIIAHAGLKARIREVPSSRRAGTVIEQSPAPSTRVARDAVIQVEVAKAPAPELIDVPDVVGSSAGDARSALRSAQLTVTVVKVDSDDPAGTVESQSPRAGAQVRTGSEVTLRVSRGPSTIDVPDVTGLDEASATAQLEQAGFQVRVTDESTTEATQDGIVLQQSPAGGSARQGSTVTITVARFD